MPPHPAESPLPLRAESSPPLRAPPADPADRSHGALEAAWRVWQAALSRLVAEEERQWAVLAAEAWPDADVVTVLDDLHLEERRAYAAYRAVLSVPEQDHRG
jgi:hypothetical protein